MKISRGEIITRGLTGRCPNCGRFGLFRHWFRLNKTCSGCGMELEKEESGFYFGTTSIGYVLAIIIVLIPICFLVIADVLSVWIGVTIAILGSILLVVATYPVLLAWVLMSYYFISPNGLPENQSKD